MIRHDFSCDAGHTFEAIVESALVIPPRPCAFPDCANMAERAYLPSRARRGDSPIVIHRDSQGNIRYPGRADAPVPRGYERVEMSIHEARNFCTTINREERSKMSTHLENMQRAYADVHDADRKDLLSQMRHMSPRGRAFAEHVIEENNRKEANKYYSTDPGFHIDGLE